MPQRTFPSYSLHAFRANALRVADGTNLGDPMGFAAELALDDIYRLSPLARLEPLSIILSATPPYRITKDSPLGTPGADLHLDCIISFMDGSGETTEALILVETDAEGGVADVFVMPLAQMAPRTDYVLVGIDTDTPLQRFARMACASFTRGTHITMANGIQTPVEDLRPGDRVLTRDSGPQEIRWIGHDTLRAVGAFAPIRIRQGTLSNARDLIVSPDQRLFIYQRSDKLGVGRSEALVRARHIVNGDSVAQLSGGFVEYYQMIFDSHQIVFAEGIAVESMLLDGRTSAALPQELSDRLDSLLPGHRRSDQGAFEVAEKMLDRPDAAELLRRSSTG